MDYFKVSFISAFNDLRQNRNSPYNKFYYYKDELIEIKIDYRNPIESYTSSAMSPDFVATKNKSHLC